MEAERVGNSQEKPAHLPHHVIDPVSGMMENPSYSYAFNVEKKKEFLRVFKEQGLGIYATCEAIGIKRETLNKHYRLDQEFKRRFDEARLEYGDRLESMSRLSAMKEKNVIERIFQLKSLFPERYGDQKGSFPAKIEIKLDSSLIEQIANRTNVIDAEIVSETSRNRAEIENRKKDVSGNCLDNSINNNDKRSES